MKLQPMEERGRFGGSGVKEGRLRRKLPGLGVGGAITRANLESFGRRIRRAVRDEENEGKRNGRR